MNHENIKIVFKDSMYLSRLYIDINMCLKHLNDVINSQIFIEENQDKYLQFLNHSKDPNKSIPFTDHENQKEINKILYCKIWDSFLLYLKNLIFIASSTGSELSNSKINEIDNYRYKKIKEALDRLRICPLNQPQWEHFDNLNKLRNKITHNHELGYVIKTLKTQSNKHLEEVISISDKTLEKIAENIINFSKKIDKEFLKNYPGIIT